VVIKVKIFVSDFQEILNLIDEKEACVRGIRWWVASVLTDIFCTGFDYRIDIARIAKEGRDGINLQQIREYFALPTNIHFFTPIFLNFAFTDGSIDKPTQIPDLKLPCWTFLLQLFGTFNCIPAYLFSFIFQGQS
jgi:hypothetical protein